MFWNYMETHRSLYFFAKMPIIIHNSYVLAKYGYLQGGNEGWV